MKIKRFFYLPAILFFLAGALYPVNVRGKIVAQNSYNPGYYPLNEAKVELFEKKDNKWVLVKKAITSADGVYSFSDLQPGQYVIRVNGRLTYPVTIKEGETQTLAPIVVKY